jgi:hypothetical protein
LRDIPSSETLFVSSLSLVAEVELSLVCVMGFTGDLPSRRRRHGSLNRERSPGGIASRFRFRRCQRQMIHSFARLHSL